MTIKGIIASVSCFCLIIFFMSFYIISPGEVGVVVDLFGSNKGVEDKEIGVGMHVIAPWKSVYKFPTYEQNFQWTKDEGFNFQTSEGLSVTADVGINYHLMPDRIHELFCKYRRGMEEITHLFIRNTIRDGINRIASKMKIEEIYGPKKEEFFQNVLTYVKGDLEPLGFMISHIYIIGRFEVPQNILDSLNLKIAATQKAQQRENELREAEAEAKKQIALAEGRAKSQLIEAKAQADANNMITKSLTTELIQYHAVNKWNGITPHIMGSSGMIFNLPVESR